ncbi:DUF2953 domain-containing protein [Lederbergia citrea]|uniref:DUF2953 domain-containing protein n=1 Tax=Lederbergia citrea TaxID=2833581 RepID=UPI001BCA1AFC|nr:DUF2953 domain-containing protein [Lederbergia citrea]MBS4176035.1 DUF2953 domain-containing protein [Lederbergia citrea]
MALSILIMVILFFVTLFIGLLFMKIKIEIIVKVSPANSRMTIRGRTLFGLVRVKKEFSIEKIISDTENLEEKPSREKFSLHDLNDAWEEIKRKYEETKPFRKIIFSFLRKIHIRKFEWNTVIGMGDAAASAIAAGAVWSIKGAVLALLRSNLLFKKSPSVTVIPHFQQLTGEMSLRCMATLRAGNAMKAGYKLYKEWKRWKKDTVPLLLETEQTADRRIIDG